MRPGRFIAALAAAALLLGAGWTAAVVIHNPQETSSVEIEPSLITTPVTSGSIGAPLWLDGVITTAGTTSLVVTAPESRVPVVSEVPVSAGYEVTWCSTLVVASGRPVFALQGAVPAYRDLTIGDSGDDVRQLQDALRSCGLYNGRSDGLLGPVTMAAAKRMYRSAGYTVDQEDTETAAPLADSSPSADNTSAEAEPTAEAAEAGTATDPQPAATATATATTTRVPWIRARDLAFIRAPGRVLTVPALGQSIGTDPILTIAHDGMTLRVTFSVAVRTQLSEGMAATATVGDSTFDFTMPALPEAPTVDEATGTEQYSVVVPLADADLELDGQAATVEVRTGDSTTYPLVVPATAVHQRADGSSFLLRVTDTGVSSTTSTPTAARAVHTDGTTEIDVTIRATGDGQIAVEPVTPGDLAVDDLVVVGNAP